MSKIIDIKKAVEQIKDGSVVAIGGNTLNRAPMSFVREIARQNKRNLHIVKTAGGMDVDMLCLNGCVSSVDAGFVSYETKYGLANNYRKAVQSGIVKANEHACYTVISALRAASIGVSFMPVKGLINSDLIEANDYFKKVVCPFTFEEYTAVKAIEPDVCIIHVQECDKQGNAKIIGAKYDDVLMTRASKKVIVVTEQIVLDNKFKNDPTQVDVPQLLVDEIVVSPQGAYPNACYKKYGANEANIKAYLNIKNADELSRYLKTLEIKDYAGMRR